MSKPLKYLINESFFDVIDTEDKAYILGLFFADGCNNPGKYNSISLTLKSQDRYILEKICKLIFISERPLYYRKSKTIKIKNKTYICSDQYTLNICNKHMSNTLKNHGMVKNKSSIIKFPYFLESRLYRHFIRGYFDGDGCITKAYRNRRKNKSIEYYTSLLSNKLFCEQLQSIIEKELKIKTKICKHVNVYRLQIYGNNVSNTFLTWLYSENNICLKRKEELYKELIEYKIKHNEERKEKYKNIVYSKKRNKYSVYIIDESGKRKHRGYYNSLDVANSAFKRLIRKDKN